jgi:acyl-CoA reductase-like NAD-dependent aldehyde dehydrogenase
MSLPFADETARARLAQRGWAGRPVRDRLRPVRAFRHLLVEHADDLLAVVRDELGRPPDEVTAADLLPTAAACRFLEREAARVLAPRRVGGRPLWLLGCRDAVHRRPHGAVAVIGTWNYPVFLNAVPILHALAAGNAVVWKPSEIAPRTADRLHALLLAAGFPADVIVKLPATREAGPQVAEADVDFVHFTGSDAVGRRLAARLGERLVPSALELSGCDALFVLADADVGLAARAAWYGATLNGGRTCMATRRAVVDRRVYDAFVSALQPLTKSPPSPPIAMGGRSPTLILNPPQDAPECREATFAPRLAVLPFDTLDQAIAMHDASPFGLTAAIFTADPVTAATLAARLPVGGVTVNDVIVPTAHPGTPFGGRRASGWGVTQGPEGLLQMTVPQTVTVRAGRFRPHVDAALAGDPAAGDVVRGMLRLTHARRLRDRLGGLWQLLGGMRRTGKGGWRA